MRRDIVAVRSSIVRRHLRLGDVTILVLVAGLSLAAVGAPMFDPKEVIQILQLGGTTGVLVLVALAFIRRIIVTSGELDKLESIYTKTISQQNDEINRMEQRIGQLQADKDLLRELAYRNQGSQHVQATAVREVAEAMIHMMSVNSQSLPGQSGG